MANNSKMNFEFVGSLSLAEDTDKSLHYEVRDFTRDDGSKNELKTLKLVMKCGDDTFSPRIQGWGGDTIYTLDKTFKKLSFPAKEYEKHLDDIANFKKFTFNDGESRFEFAREFEFIDFLNTKLKDNPYGNRLFKVNGEIEMSSYEDKEGNTKTFTNYKVQRIYVADENGILRDKELVVHAKANVVCYIDHRALDETELAEKNKLNITYYLGQFDSKKKKAGMLPERGFVRHATYEVSDDPYKKAKQVSILKEKIFRCDEDTLAMTGFSVNLINRGGKVEFDESMLTEEEKEFIELDFCTFEDIKKEHEFGISEYITGEEICGFKKPYLSTGSDQTKITLKELLATDQDKVQESFEVVDEDDEFGDLFGDEMDIPF